LSWLVFALSQTDSSVPPDALFSGVRFSNPGSEQSAAVKRPPTAPLDRFRRQTIPPKKTKRQPSSALEKLERDLHYEWRERPRRAAEAQRAEQKVPLPSHPDDEIGDRVRSTV
jgi:hypothetical protein